MERWKDGHSPGSSHLFLQDANHLGPHRWRCCSSKHDECCSLAQHPGSECSPVEQNRNWNQVKKSRLQDPMHCCSLTHLSLISVNFTAHPIFLLMLHNLSHLGTLPQPTAPLCHCSLPPRSRNILSALHIESLDTWARVYFLTSWLPVTTPPLVNWYLSLDPLTSCPIQQHRELLPIFLRFTLQSPDGLATFFELHLEVPWQQCLACTGPWKLYYLTCKAFQVNLARSHLPQGLLLLH